MKEMIFVAAAAARPLGLYGVIAIVALVAAGLIAVRLLASRRAATPSAPPTAEAEVASPTQAMPAGPGKVPASGSLGEVDLNSVDPRTAAMLMAIVADKIGVPLNQLRFVSIKEI